MACYTLLDFTSIEDEIIGGACSPSHHSLLPARCAGDAI